MTVSPPKLDRIDRLLDAVYPAFALLAGMELDLFTPLAKGPLNVEQLASTLGVQSGKLRSLLYVLVVAEILEVEDDYFSNSAEADHYLVRGKPAYLGGMHDLISGNWAKALKSAATIRNGGPVEEYDYHSMPRKELHAILEGLNPASIVDARRLMERHDFSAASRLLDVGGGSGGLAIAIAQANPHLRATVVDLPLVIPVTRQFIEEAGAEDRVDVVTADAVHEALPWSYDVVVARHLLQVLSENDIRTLLGNLAGVTEPGGTIHLIGWILDDSRLTPEKTVNYNLVLLNGYADGQAYTEGEHRKWLTEAGFVSFERVTLGGGASIVTARKPHVS